MALRNIGRHRYIGPYSICLHLSDYTLERGRKEPTGIRPTGHFEIALNLLGNTQHIFTALVGQLSHLIE